MPKINLFNNENNLTLPYVAAKRIDFGDYTDESLRQAITDHCIDQGKPLVISNMDKSPAWDESIFTLDQLKVYRGDMEIDLKLVREHNRIMKARLGDFIETLQKKYELSPSSLPSSSAAAAPYQVNQTFHEKVYAKDILCPAEYRTAIGAIIPEHLLPHGSTDLFSSLPERFQAENLMCYLGQSKTGTPLHRDLCGTMGHNLMTMASPGGYAEWFIIEDKYRHALAEVLKPTVVENKRTNRTDRIKTTHKRKRSGGDHGNNLRVSKRRKASNVQQEPSPSASPSTTTKSSFMESDRAWLSHYLVKKSTAVIHVVVQRPGDLVIIPSRAYHQVRNHGVSVKVAWNRITPQTLTYAFEDQLPLYHIINRPEVYKCKAIVALTLTEWRDHLASSSTVPPLFDASTFLVNIKMLLQLLLHNVVEPELLYDGGEVATDPSEDHLTIKCDFCHGDIFHRYYHCEDCEGYDLCMDCYALGRACQHPDAMVLRQGAVDIQHYVELYRDLVVIVNRIFPDSIQVGLENDILNRKANTANNLATVCRRLETYRTRMSSCHMLKCSHCSKSTRIATLAKQGISLASVFGRGPCRSFGLNDETFDVDHVFVCERCTSRCEHCWPLSKQQASLEDLDLVYYLHPAHDPRSQGGFIDYSIKRTCDDVAAASSNTRPSKKQRTKRA